LRQQGLDRRQPLFQGADFPGLLAILASLPQDLPGLLLHLVQQPVWRDPSERNPAPRLALASDSIDYSRETRLRKTLGRFVPYGEAPTTRNTDPAVRNALLIPAERCGSLF
jgi:hypothetical protein